MGAATAGDGGHGQDSKETTASGHRVLLMVTCGSASGESLAAVRLERTVL